MRSRLLLSLQLLVLGVLALLCAPDKANACCGVQPPHMRIQLADQEILVTWNAKTRRETFVRRAAFRTSARDFGFLVPTPTQPKLAEAPDEVFDRLRELTAPRIIEDPSYRPNFTPLVLYPFGFLITASRAPTMRAAVRVLDHQRVAGYDATVLEADGADALTEWLGKHGYAATPEVRVWIEPYVAKKWKITAFRYDVGSKGPRGQDAATGAISMSFETDRPLFPFRVPTSQIAPRGQGSTLRVYYAGEGRIEGTLGEAARAWDSTVQVARPIDDLAPRLLGVVPPDALPPGTWLTAFDDHAWPSGTEDLYFRKSATQTLFERVEHRTREVSVPIPPDVLLLACLFVGWQLFRGRK